jgi:hypothetical protein
VPEQVVVVAEAAEAVKQELVELAVLQPGGQNDPPLHRHFHLKMSVVVL